MRPTIGILAVLGAFFVVSTAVGEQIGPRQSNPDGALGDTNIAGSLSIYTGGAGVGITSGTMPLSPVRGLLHVESYGSELWAAPFMASAHWTGSTDAPYQNNDTGVFMTFNNVTSDSLNQSWAVSASNAYNKIPAGVTDSGVRYGVLGWATSVAHGAYVHEGTLTTQIGAGGAAGFQGPGSSASAVITSATAVQGLIYNDSPGSNIINAQAGAFISTAVTGVVQNNTAVYATAANGTVSNYSFYGAAGTMFNDGQVRVGNELTQSSSALAARRPGNSVEFGHSDPSGYGSNLGATPSYGYPFLAFSAESDPSGNTFRTRGKPGTAISSDNAGALIFSRLTDKNASGQALTESARFDADGHLVLASTPYLASRTPASSSATCATGEVTWDPDYLYVCVATNAWKRVALSSW